MYFDLNGVTFTRLQSSGTGAIGDPLAPGVLFDGRSLGGLCMSKQQAVDAGSNVGSQGYTIQFGRTMTNPPIVLGMLKLSQAYVDNFGTRWFEANEFVTTCSGIYNKFGQGRARNFAFAFTVFRDRIALSIGGFAGTASFLIVELD